MQAHTSDNCAQDQVIGIDVGGTNIRLGVFQGIHCLKETRFEANLSKICAENPPDVAWQAILDLLVGAIAGLVSAFPAVKRVGLGFPGFIDPVTNVIESSPNLPGLKDVNLAADLAGALNASGHTLTVSVANDANVAALGEYYLAGRPDGGLIFCGLGTGVGGGLVINGKPYAGNNGCAMEVGHLIVKPNGRQCGCGNLGCLETYASAKGIANSYFERAGKQHSAAQIAAFAEAGDADALAAYQQAADCLAQALASISKVLDVKNILIGGGVAAAWHLMAPTFDARLKADLIPVLRDKIYVQIASGSDLAGMIGAGMLSIDS